MNRLPSIVRQHIAALRAAPVFTVICGIIYPVFMLGHRSGGLPQPRQRLAGQLQRPGGRSSLLCQEFVDAKGNPLPQYFQPRPSDATSGAKTDYGCDPLFSAATNLGPTNPPRSS